MRDTEIHERQSHETGGGRAGGGFANFSSSFLYHFNQISGSSNSRAALWASGGLSLKSSSPSCCKNYVDPGQAPGVGSGEAAPRDVTGKRAHDEARVNIQKACAYPTFDTSIKAEGGPTVASGTCDTGVPNYKGSGTLLRGLIFNPIDQAGASTEKVRRRFPDIEGVVPRLSEEGSGSGARTDGSSHGGGAAVPSSGFAGKLDGYRSQMSALTGDYASYGGDASEADGTCGDLAGLEAQDADSPQFEIWRSAGEPAEPHTVARPLKLRRLQHGSQGVSAGELQQREVQDTCAAEVEQEPGCALEPDLDMPAPGDGGAPSGPASADMFAWQASAHRRMAAAAAAQEHSPFFAASVAAGHADEAYRSALEAEGGSEQGLAAAAGYSSYQRTFVAPTQGDQGLMRHKLASQRLTPARMLTAPLLTPLGKSPVAPASAATTASPCASDRSAASVDFNEYLMNLSARQGAAAVCQDKKRRRCVASRFDLVASEELLALLEGCRRTLPLAKWADESAIFSALAAAITARQKCTGVGAAGGGRPVGRDLGCEAAGGGVHPLEEIRCHNMREESSHTGASRGAFKEGGLSSGSSSKQEMEKNLRIGSAQICVLQRFEKSTRKLAAKWLAWLLKMVRKSAQRPRSLQHLLFSAACVILPRMARSLQDARAAGVPKELSGTVDYVLCAFEKSKACFSAIQWDFLRARISDCRRQWQRATSARAATSAKDQATAPGEKASTASQASQGRSAAQYASADATAGGGPAVPDVSLRGEELDYRSIGAQDLSAAMQIKQQHQHGTGGSSAEVPANKELGLAVDASGDALESSIKSMVEQAMREKLRSAEEERRSIVRGKNKQGHREAIGRAGVVLSLSCPLARQRIQVPARTASCLHRACFDLQVFLKRQVLSPAFTAPGSSAPGASTASQVSPWLCPICGVEATWQSLVVDGFILSILTGSPKSTLAVRVFSDASWLPVGNPSRQASGAARWQPGNALEAPMQSFHEHGGSDRRPRATPGRSAGGPGGAMYPCYSSASMRESARSARALSGGSSQWGSSAQEEGYSGQAAGREARLMEGEERARPCSRTEVRGSYQVEYASLGARPWPGTDPSARPGPGLRLARGAEAGSSGMDRCFETFQARLRCERNPRSPAGGAPSSESPRPPLSPLGVTADSSQKASQAATAALRRKPGEAVQAWSSELRGACDSGAATPSSADVDAPMEDSWQREGLQRGVGQGAVPFYTLLEIPARSAGVAAADATKLGESDADLHAAPGVSGPEVGAGGGVWSRRRTTAAAAAEECARAAGQAPAAYRAVAPSSQPEAAAEVKRDCAGAGAGAGASSIGLPASAAKEVGVGCGSWADDLAVPSVASKFEYAPYGGRGGGGGATEAANAPRGYLAFPGPRNGAQEIRGRANEGAAPVAPTRSHDFQQEWFGLTSRWNSRGEDRRTAGVGMDSGAAARGERAEGLRGGEGRGSVPATAAVTPVMRFEYSSSGPLPFSPARGGTSCWVGRGRPGEAGGGGAESSGADASDSLQQGEGMGLIMTSKLAPAGDLMEEQTGAAGAAELQQVPGKAEGPSALHVVSKQSFQQWKQGLELGLGSGSGLGFNFQRFANSPTGGRLNRAQGMFLRPRSVPGGRHEPAALVPVQDGGSNGSPHHGSCPVSRGGMRDAFTLNEGGARFYGTSSPGDHAMPGSPVPHNSSENCVEGVAGATLGSPVLNAGSGDRAGVKPTSRMKMMASKG
eukprot:jgi/Mesen1/1352/ME000013S00845